MDRVARRPSASTGHGSSWAPAISRPRRVVCGLTLNRTLMSLLRRLYGASCLPNHRAQLSSSRPSANRHHGSPLPAIDSPLMASSNILPNIMSESGSTEPMKYQARATARGCGRLFLSGSRWCRRRSTDIKLLAQLSVTTQRRPGRTALSSCLRSMLTMSMARLEGYDWLFLTTAAGCLACSAVERPSPCPSHGSLATDTTVVQPVGFGGALRRLHLPCQ